MKGLDILKNGHLEKVENGSTTLDLLGRGSGIELMRQTVKQGSTFMLFPGDQKDAQEFFYILAGEVEAEVNGGILKLGTNDFFSCKNLESAIHFTVLKDVTFLSVSTTPVFHYLSNMISELRKIGMAVEKKDRYTFNHSSRVANYAVKTSAKMKLGKEQIENLFLASILHDIGKINIPEEVLKKPSKLTNEEFEVVKKHPGDGAKMIRETAYADLADIVEQHHERVNGRGYPFGLKGDEILIEAKIIGVCDTFDAMTEDRAYRSAFSAEYAMAELNSLVGEQYDEDVVKAFEQVLKEEGKLTT
ncbi:putative nucleotidyltransferase with HDIG domain [Planomicrobium stackebrandtii]|uniref:Nucleotidyltransferase with HDIG domain n=1 Tax=Planomicrobium stackebrandtii TaxID=253160 RepID=A0ABU0GSC0_9BACL|nr:HD domain-containing phosphohydrolase [Planomicrobium stackebrandtii]MDQ0427958.1 putative nucleotidyltransferase with HDIG domain [Planomicrobium stackebrandtii]